MAGIFGLLMSGAGVIKDQYFNLTTLLLPGNGTNGAQNNTFLDSSTNNFTITRNGNTTQGTFSPFSQTGWGNYFDGSGDYLSVANTAALQLSNSTAWTVELWFYATALASEKAIFNGFNPSGSPNYNGFGLNLGSNGQPATTLMMFDGTNWTNIATVSANQWYHVAVSYEGSGTTRRCFLNGVLQGSAGTVPSTITNTSTATAIGALSNGNFSFPGYISNVRVVKGTAVYTSNFTPPTSPLTAITNTSLLTCQSNRFVDNSGTPLTITANGNTSVTPFSPFAPTAAYTTAAVGGSGYFDGTGDYLTVPDNASLDMGSSDFTIEGWVYLTSSGASQSFIAKCTGADSQASYHIVFNGTNWLYYLSGNGSTWSIANGVSMGAGVVNAWQHLALVRNGSTFTPYINGTAGTTTSSATALFDSNKIFSIGADDTGAQRITGYISNVRVVKGTAIVPPAGGPTAPLTAITNTSLLLNFTNAGITDATAKNDLETVGNAQISTSVSKFGGGSIAFDGTGDYLIRPYSDILNINSGDFTIEAWVYPTANKTFNTIASMWGTAQQSWIFDINNGVAGFAWQANSVSVNFLESGSVSLNTWSHLAVTRAGNTFKLFVNGTQTASSTSSNNSLTTIFIVGAYDSGANGNFAGYIDDLRITKGYARYTSNFTPSTAPFPVQ